MKKISSSTLINKVTMNFRKLDITFCCFIVLMIFQCKTIAKHKMHLVAKEKKLNLHEKSLNHKMLKRLTKKIVTVLKNSKFLWNSERNWAKHVAQLKLQCFWVNLTHFNAFYRYNFYRKWLFSYLLIVFSQLELIFSVKKRFIQQIEFLLN